MVPGGFDAVLATDVLYDVETLPSLLETASACLGDAPPPGEGSCDNGVGVVAAGHLCLSHVPRACYTSENPPVPDLEAHIVEQARLHGFELFRAIRPDECPQPPGIPSGALNYVTMRDLQQAGAAILVFRKAAPREDRVARG
jgi:hypothetical protein